MLICNFCITRFEGLASQDFDSPPQYFFRNPYGSFIRLNVLKICRVGIQFREGIVLKKFGQW